MSKFNYTGPKVAVDAVVFMYLENDKYPYLLIIERQDGTRALPGGMVDGTDDSILAAARRELEEETGFVTEVGDWDVHQLSFNKKDRDPRDWIITYSCHYSNGSKKYKSLEELNSLVQAGDDAKKAYWISAWDLHIGEWFADHPNIIEHYL